MTDRSLPASNVPFPTTQWSRLVAAGDRASPEANEALAELCRAYWFPIYAFIRRRGFGPEPSRNLTQDFFARLLEKGVFAQADPARGRFRTFLRAVCADFLADHRDRENSLRRGGGRALLPLDMASWEGRLAREPAHELTAERLFDRKWALTLLTTAHDRLRVENTRAGRTEIFEALNVFLTEGPRAVPCATLAAQLRMTEGAVRVAVHRLRDASAKSFARRSPRRWPIRPMSTMRSASSSPHSTHDPEKTVGGRVTFGRGILIGMRRGSNDDGQLRHSG